MPAINVFDLEVIARERLSQEAYDYFAGGAHDEVTLRENRRPGSAFPSLTGSSGKAGGAYVLQPLREEFDLAMALADTPTGFDITRDLVRYPLARLVPVSSDPLGGSR